MGARATALVGPLFLFACLTLGGSAQGIWTNLALQLGAIVIIAASLIAGRRSDGRAQVRLRWLVAAMLAVAVLQLVPLPPEIWTRLPGREPVVEGFTLLGSDLPWLPVSLAPEATVSALLACLPAGAMLAWVLRWSDGRSDGVIVAVLAATVVSVVVGLIQYTSSDPWYPYRHSSFGAATGLFANSNHMASLLLSAIPLLAAVAVAQWRRSGKSAAGQRLAVMIALATCAGAILVGIIVNGSLAVILLGGPMVVASLLIFLPSVGVRAGRLAVLILAAIGAGIAALLAIGIERLISIGGAASASERLEILRSSVRMAMDYAPVGSGLGTFAAAYHLQENPETVTWPYANHVHNDYVELVIELGLAGGVVLIAFLAWWAWRFTGLWRSSATQPAVRAATLVTLGLLLHSLVDFPLRTAALSALFATAIGVMAAPGVRRPAEGRGQPRHLTLDDL